MVQFVAFGWSWLKWNLDGTLKTCPKTPANSPWCPTTRCTTPRTRTCGARTLRKFSDLIFSEETFWLVTDKIHWPLLAINVQLAILGPELNCYVKSNPENRRDTKGTWWYILTRFFCSIAKGFCQKKNRESKHMHKIMNDQVCEFGHIYYIALFWWIINGKMTLWHAKMHF